MKLLKSLAEKIISWFHHEVDDITTPITKIVARLEKFSSKLDARVKDARVFASWGESELNKAAKTAEKLSGLLK